MKIIFLILVFFCVFPAVYFYRIIIRGAESGTRRYKEKVNRLLKESMSKIAVKEIIKYEALFALAGISFSFISGEMLFLGAAIPVMAVFPKIYINNRQKKYVKEYCEGLPGFLESLVSSLKSGLSIVKAFGEFSAKDSTPVEKEIGIVLKRIELGKSMQKSLEELAERIPIRENQIIISAINTSIETGGNLSEVLENIMETLRKREELNREVGALTAQGVMSGIVAGLLPVILLLIIAVIDIDFIKPLFTTGTGMAMLGTALLMETTGIIFIRKIVNIK